LSIWGKHFVAHLHGELPHAGLVGVCEDEAHDWEEQQRECREEHPVQRENPLAHHHQEGAEGGWDDIHSEGGLAADAQNRAERNN